MKNVTCNFFKLLSAIVLISCASAKIGSERVKIQSGSITQKDVILLKSVQTDNMLVTGDDSSDEGKAKAERAIIGGRLTLEILSLFQKKGFNVVQAGEGTIVLEVRVTAFNHGSASKRSVQGFDRDGASHLDVTFKGTRGGQTIFDFDVIASSGGRKFKEASSQLGAHVSDAAAEIVQYIGAGKYSRK